MTHPVLSLQNITRIYTQGESGLKVLDHLNLDIKKGEAVALIGQSGSGKSTLLQIAGLLDSPSSGQVWIAGIEMSAANETTRTEARGTHIGFVYQFHHLLPEFTALENVMMPQLITGANESEAQEKALDLLSTLGLAERVSHRPAKLSGGEQQRVAIARALANDPALLLADEPTGNPDPETAAQVFQLLVKAVQQKGISALIATHNMELAKNLDRVVRLEGGKLS